MQEIWASEPVSDMKSCCLKQICRETSPAAVDINAHVSAAYDLIALKIGMDVDTGLVYAPIKYETNWVQG